MAVSTSFRLPTPAPTRGRADGVPVAPLGATQAQILAKAPQTQQTLAANTMNRSEGGKDFDQDKSQFMSVLDGLRNAGYLGSGGSASASGASGGAAPVALAPWTPSTYGGGASGGGGGTAPQAGLGNAGEAGAAAFARAKDRVGQSTMGLMKSLRNQFAGRGMSGGSAEVNATGNTLLGANQQLADVARDEAIKETDVNADFAKTRYAGGITQRGQDMGALANERSLSLSARGQDASVAEGNANRSATAALHKDDNVASILGLWNAFTGRTSAARY